MLRNGGPAAEAAAQQAQVLAVQEAAAIAQAQTEAAAAQAKLIDQTPAPEALPASTSQPSSTNELPKEEAENLGTTVEGVKEPNKEASTSQVSSSNSTSSNNVSVKSDELTSKEEGVVKAMIKLLEVEQDPIDLLPNILQEHQKLALENVLKSFPKIEGAVKAITELKKVGLDASCVNLPGEFKGLVSQFIENATSQISHQNDTPDINIDTGHYDSQADIPDVVECSGVSGDISGEHTYG